MKVTYRKGDEVIEALSDVNREFYEAHGYSVEVVGEDEPFDLNKAEQEDLEEEAPKGKKAK